jgi:CO dehydrogenase/acetyl-CoA synthase gamma subunit (corrinoid Fe-S protein)
LNIIGTTDTPGQSVDIYISGSAFGTDEIGYGKLIKTITLKDSININTVSVPFTADNTGYGKLKFKFTLGN